jgi:hypothetical protein
MGSLDMNAILTKERANSANSANPEESEAEISKVSEISTASYTRTALDELFQRTQWATLEYGIHATKDEVFDVLGVSGCKEIEAAAQRVLQPLGDVRVFALSVVLRRGIVPEGWTAITVCLQCGPVWVPPGGAAEVSACPWCSLRRAARWFPCPRMECGQCRHFRPDSINPPGGLGSCAVGHDGKWLCFPHSMRECSDWRAAVGGQQI